PYDVPVETVSGGARRYLEIEAIVDRVRIVLAQVVLDPARPQHWPGQAVLNRLLGADHADVPRAGDEDLVLGEQAVDVLDAVAQAPDQRPALLLEAGLRLPRHAADAEVVVHDPLAGQLFEEPLDVLAVAEGVSESGAENANVGAERAH